jgi:hypothetical protein
MQVIQTQPIRLGFWSVLLIGILAWAPATYPGYWQGLEGFVPVLNASQPSPLASVATTPDLWRGMGNDAFLLARPLLLLGWSPTAAVRAIFICAFLLGGLGIYVWLQPRLGDRSAGLAGLIYIFLPTFLATAYVRGSLSDALILALLPMALAGIATYAQNRSATSAAVVVIAMVWMWRTQAGLTLLATLLLLLYTLLVERQRLCLLVVAVSGAAGGASLLPIWSVRGAAAVPFDQHFVAFFQLFAAGWQVAPSIPGWQDGYPFQLGFAALIFAMVAVWLWLFTAHPLREAVTLRLLRFCGLGFPLLTLLCLEPSNWLWQVSGASRLCTYPWQICLLAAPLLAMLAGSLPALYAEFSTTLLWCALVILVVLSSYGALTTDFTQVTAPPTPLAIFGPHHNIALLEATLVESREPRQAVVQITWQALHPLDFDHNIFVQALAGDPAFPSVVAQIDAQPLDGQRPITSWRPGEILSDTYRLDLTNAPVEGELRYILGYYDWRDGKRLPVNGGLDDKWVVNGR